MFSDQSSILLRMYQGERDWRVWDERAHDWLRDSDHRPLVFPTAELADQEIGRRS